MTLSAIPRATYRLQFHRDFTLDDAVPLVPYLADLGISHVYSSPLLKARPGSTHCYDIVDHSMINPELGGEDALRRLVAALRAHDMGMILDIVPNHMGIGGSDNRWWLDVLEWGRASPYAEYFDIDWEPPDPAFKGRIMVPFLGTSYGEALANNDLVLRCTREDGDIFVAYHEHHFPISVRGVALILHHSPVLKDIAAEFAAAGRAGSRNIARSVALQAKRRLADIARTIEGETALTAALARFAGDNPDGQRRLNELLERQHYRLTWWRAAADEINYRRFFDINALAGLRTELPRVFDAIHQLILQLYTDGLIDGVRIDHIDGLAHPRLYCRKLRRSMETAAESRPSDLPHGLPYIVVEKILAAGERLPADWATDGTTGYDFMDQVSAVLHDPDAEAALTLLWISLTGRPGEFETEEHAARRQILRDNLASELFATASALHRIARRDLFTRDYTLTAIRRAVAELLTYFPVYRVYAGRAGRTDVDAQVMERAIAAARRSFRAADLPLLDVVRRWLAEEAPRNLPGGPRRSERLRAMVRFQQLSAPVAAKSVEDTAFYRYGRLLSRNEVGSYPGQFALSPQAFHAACTERQRRLPHAMLATATHDHKRGEDSRARLAVISEIPDEWETAITRWARLNQPLRRDLPVGSAPSPSDEIMLYQTLVSAWPLGLSIDDAGGLDAFEQRVAAWAEKSVREAKLRSEWAAPDEAYESAYRGLIAGCFARSRPVIGEIAAFAARMDLPGAINGLSQTLLRLVSPGMPDTYQGAELWDQSLVDPDNRRPVDYARRIEQLSGNAEPGDLMASWRDGAVKQAIIARALRLRREMPEFFENADYRKLEAQGPAAPHVLAFTRYHRGQLLIAAVTRLPASLLEDAITPVVSPEAWRGTSIMLPAGEWRDALGGKIAAAGEMPVAALFARLPVALLVSANTQDS